VFRRIERLVGESYWRFLTFLSRLEPAILVGDGVRETAREYSKGGKGMIAICENESLDQD
jgi:hypothetical protein